MQRKRESNDDERERENQESPKKLRIVDDMNYIMRKWLAGSTPPENGCLEDEYLKVQQDMQSKTESDDDEREREKLESLTKLRKVDDMSVREVSPRQNIRDSDSPDGLNARQPEETPPRPRTRIPSGSDESTLPDLIVEVKHMQHACFRITIHIQGDETVVIEGSSSDSD